MKASPEVRMDGKGAAGGTQSLQLRPSPSSTQAPVGRLWSPEFCCHWEKNQPHSQTPQMVEKQVLEIRGF